MTVRITKWECRRLIEALREGRVKLEDELWAKDLAARIEVSLEKQEEKKGSVRC